MRPNAAPNNLFFRFLIILGIVACCGTAVHAQDRPSAADFDGETVHVDPSEDGQGIQNAIDQVQPGSTIVLESGTFVVRDPFLCIDKRIYLKGNGEATIKLGDHIRQKTGQEPSSVIELVEQGNTGQNADGTLIENIHIDGNFQNNEYGEHGGSYNPFSHGIRVGGRTLRSQERYVANNVVLRDITVTNTIRSGIDGDMKNTYMKNIHVIDSATDHHIYLAGAMDTVLEDVVLEGHSRRASLVFGTTGRDIAENEIRDLTIKNLEETPNGDVPDPAIIFRGEGKTQGNNTIKNVRILAQGAKRRNGEPFGTWIQIRQPNTTIDGLEFATHLDKDNGALVNFGVGSEGSILRDARILVPSTDDAQRPTIAFESGKIGLEKIRIRETSEREKLRGIHLDPAHDHITDITINGLYVDIGRQWLWAENSKYRTENLTITNFKQKRAKPPHIPSGAAVNYTVQ